MIYNFSIWSLSMFRVNGAIYLRTARVYRKRNGLYRLKNSSGILIDDMPFANIRIDGVPITSILELEAVISNISCICADIPPPVHARIFDMTFDLTFE